MNEAQRYVIGGEGQNIQKPGNIHKKSTFRVHPDTGLIVRDGADSYMLFPSVEIIDLEASLKRYIRKTDIDQNDFDHATQIFSYLYLHSESEKREEYLECFHNLYAKILSGNFNQRIKDEIISFCQVFLLQVETNLQVKTVLEIQ